MTPNQQPRTNRLLFAWEVGANLGHIMPLLRLALHVQRDGYDCVIAARDLGSAQIALSGAGAYATAPSLGHKGPRLVQSPVWPPHIHAGNEDGQAGYLDVLALLGFAETAKLMPMMRAWDSLLDMIQPDLVIADHAPALVPLLNARGTPSIAIGNGFTLPPLHPTPFPPLYAARAPIVPQARLFASLCQVLNTLGYDAPNDWETAFSGGISPSNSQRLVVSFPELDPYYGIRKDQAFLPLDPLPDSITPPLGKRVFAYLGAELPGLNALLQSLTQLDCAVECYVRGAPPNVYGFLEAQGVMVHRTPPDLAERLPLASHVVSQGGTGMAHSALAAGRPHGIFALHGESRLTAQALIEIGAGQVFPTGRDTQVCSDMLLCFLDDHHMSQAAMNAGRMIHSRSQPSGVKAVEQALQRLLHG